MPARGTGENCERTTTTHGPGRTAAGEPPRRTRPTRRRASRVDLHPGRIPLRRPPHRGRRLRRRPGPGPASRPPAHGGRRGPRPAARRHVSTRPRHLALRRLRPRTAQLLQRRFRTRRRAPLAPPPAPDRLPGRAALLPPHRREHPTVVPPPRRPAHADPTERHA